jgi:hypothetical protein
MLIGKNALLPCERATNPREGEMVKLITTAMLLCLVSLQPSQARGGRSNSTGALLAPANPTVPPSLTPDPRLAGSAPLPPHGQPKRSDATLPPDILLRPTPEDAKVDSIVKSICRGC